MTLRAGCSVAAVIWLGLNTYFAATAFYGYSDLFSFLDRRALIVMGSICIFFSLSSLCLIYALFYEIPSTLSLAALMIIISVILHLIDILANIILFGIQIPQYLNWCLENAETLVDESASVELGQGGMIRVDYHPSSYTPELFNCRLLWEAEMKFSIAIFIVMSLCYIYWLICILSYQEKIYYIYRNNPLYYVERPYP